MFLGMTDLSVALAYLMTLLATILCIVYGVRMWNREGDVSEEELAEERRWLKEEIDLEKDLGSGGDQ